MSQIILKDPFVSAAPVRTGTGNGTVTVDLLTHFTLTQTYTLTCVSKSPDTVFSVVGSLDGPIGLATVGTQFFDDDLKIFLTLQQGSIVFEVGDQFVFTVHQGTDVSQGNIDTYDELPQKNFGAGTRGFEAGDNSLRFKGTLLKSYKYLYDLLFKAVTGGVAGNSITIEYADFVPAVAGFVVAQDLTFTFRMGATSNNTYTLTYVDWTPANKAEVIIQDIDYLAQTGGTAGNSLNVRYTDDVTAGAEFADFDGTHLNVHIQSGVSTATQIKAACDANVSVVPIIRVTISGVGSNAQTAPVSQPTSLTGGAAAIGDAGHEVVNLTGTSLTVTLQGGTSTASQVKAAFDAYSPAFSIIACTISGTSSTAQTAPVSPVSFHSGANALGLAGAETVQVTSNAIKIYLQSGVSTATQVRTAFNASSPATALATCSLVGIGSAVQFAPVSPKNLMGGKNQEYSFNRAELTDAGSFAEGNASILAEDVHAQGQSIVDGHASFNEAVLLDDSNADNLSGPAITNAQKKINNIQSELDEYFGQLQIGVRTPTDSRIIITPSDVALLSGVLLGQAINTNLMSFAGAQVDFQSGNIYAANGTTVVSTFTPAIIGNGLYRWYALGLNIGSATADNKLLVMVTVNAGPSDGSTPTLAAKASFSSTVKLGQVVVHNISGSIQPITTSNVVQLGVGGAGTGSGGGGGDTYTGFSLNNNQTSPADVVGFLVDPTAVNGFKAEYSVRRAAIGTPYSEDTAFYTDLGSAFNDTVFAQAEQTDGKIVVGGQFITFNGHTQNYLVRLNADGTEDTAFTTSLGAAFDAVVYAVAIQTDGKILVGGQFNNFNGNSRLFLVRLNSDGTEDTAFYTNLAASFDNNIRAIAVQTDGKILLGGAFSQLNGNARGRFIRLNSDGTEDTAFITNLGIGFDNNVQAIVLQIDGKIVVGGFFTNFHSGTKNYLVRLNSDGTLNTSFYTNYVGGFSGLNSAVWALLMQSDGKIVVGGQFTNYNGNTLNKLIRLNADGTEDTAFDTNLGTGFSSTVFTVAQAADGQILVGGQFVTFNALGRNRVVLLNTDGTEDATFYTTNLGLAFNNVIQSIVVQLNGRALLGGGFTFFNSNARNRLVRFIMPLSAQEVVKEGSFRGIYRPSITEWDIGAEVSYGDDVGVEFSITSGGQLQYTSTNIPGTSLSEMRFVITKL